MSIDKNSIDNKISRVIFVKGIVKFVTPCIIGSGENDKTDIDIIRDNNGNPYIPGSSIAGVLRAYAGDNSLEDCEPEYVNILFGKRKLYRSEDESTISSLYIYDMKIQNYNGDNISTRDGVKLDPKTKTSIDQNKYDYEILNAGSSFLFRLEIVLRKMIYDKVNNQLEPLLYRIINGMINNEIRFGAKTNRGFGKCSLDKDGIEILDINFMDENNFKENYDLWINFDWDHFKGNRRLDTLSNERVERNLCTAIRVPLNISNSIIIRNYNNLTISDQKHIMSSGNYVIPGTSWSGAIRHGCYKILEYLKIDEAKIENILNDIFGYVDEANKKARSSKLLIEESKILNSKLLYQMRVKIDRFTGGAVDAALFDEEPIYGGNTEINIKIQVKENWIIGLLILVFKDIQNGFQPIGGETSIGRGIMFGKSVLINERELTKAEEVFYLRELYDKLYEKDELLVK